MHLIKRLIEVVDAEMRNGEATVVLDAADLDALVALLADYERLKRLLDTLLEVR